MAAVSDRVAPVQTRIDELIAKMTLAEKIGQMSQLNACGGWVSDELRHAIQAGQVGSVLNEVDLDTVNELQRVAVEESRLGIPLLIGRDVIHGFKTVFPIPLGQAASWNPGLVRDGARIAAKEAAAVGINWTFAPMIDITRDPRWGRVAESLGEDPHLTSVLGAAMIEGFQGDDLAARSTIAACAKHFAGYGASESGRDYNTTNVPENELRNVHLRPFRAANEAGVATFMTSFSDLDGVPASGNDFLLKQVLREQWAFDGFVVSDWDSIVHLSVHGLTENDAGSAHAAVTAGVDMEMASSSYRDHLQRLVAEGAVDESLIDDRVRNILKIKFALNLFDSASVVRSPPDSAALSASLDVARRAATQSIVLLQNNRTVLPLSKDQLGSVAVIGPMADEAYDQLGTWVFDGDPGLSVTPLAALKEYLGDDVEIRYVRAMQTTRSSGDDGFAEACDAVAASDAAVLFLGEESILSGEAHSRADIDLPGKQAELVRRIRSCGKPVVAVILAGRPLTLANIIEEVDAILFAWHPGSMAGSAITDLLFGIESPSGKLPITFPRMVGQVPVYYSHKNTGKPAVPEHLVHIEDIDANAPQTSLGMSSFHLDAGIAPLFPFGYGLSYTRFDYAGLELDKYQLGLGETLAVSVDVKNAGEVDGEEVVQLYIRDLVGSVTRPVKELKGFQRVRLSPGQTQKIRFELHTDDLAFYGRDMQLVTEAGGFHLWVGGSSADGLWAEFRLVAD